MKQVNRQLSERGFTLIELLVVMLIIGVLVAIAIPIFLNQRKKAEDAAAKADVSTLGAEVATYYVDGILGPPTVQLASGHWYIAGVDGGSASANVMLKAGVAATATDRDWCVSVYNDQGLDAALANGGVSYSAEGGLEVGASARC